MPRKGITQVEGPFDANDSGESTTMTTTSKWEILPSGTSIYLRRSNGDPPDMDLFGLPAIHKVKNETDVTTVALAFARIASNKLKVPVKCFTFLWNYPHRCQTTGEWLIDVTLNIHILDDELKIKKMI